MSRSILDKLVALRDERKAARTAGEADGGFTLIELLVVVVIIGILIAIAIPLYLNYQKGAKDKSSQSDLRAAVSALNQCYTDNGNAYPATVTFTGAGGTGTPNGTPVAPATANPCANDVINLSAGTTMVYALTTGGASYTIADSNSGGNHNATPSATAAGANYYFYNSAVGGSIQ